MSAGSHLHEAERPLCMYHGAIGRDGAGGTGSEVRTNRTSLDAGRKRVTKSRNRGVRS